MDPRDQRRRDNRDEANRLQAELALRHKELGSLPQAIDKALAPILQSLAIGRDFILKLDDDQYEGLQLRDPNEAFDRARGLVLQELDALQSRTGRRQADEAAISLNIKILAIASTHSTPFIKNTRSLVRKEFPKASISVEILLTSPDYLDRIKAGRSETGGSSWAELCRNRTSELKELMAAERVLPSKEDGPESFPIYLSYYDALPQWHGVRIGNSWLLKARTYWADQETGGYRLKTGSNFHIYDNKDGLPEIEDFNRWFDFYNRIGTEIDLH